MKKHSGKLIGGRSRPELGRWVGTLDANASVWNSTEKPIDISGIMLMSMLVSVSMFLFLLPFFALSLGIINLAAIAKSVATVSMVSFFLNPGIMFSLLGTCLMGGVLIFSLLCQTRVIRFTFDAKRKVLEFTEYRPFFKPSETLVDFNSILSITPTLMTSYATEGHFAVVIKTANGSFKDKWMGHYIPLEKLNLHAEWLSSHLGDRVQPMLRLDT